MEDIVTMTGIVVESRPDEEGNIIAIDFETHDRTYSIDPRDAGSKLFWYVDQAVEIEGRVTEDGYGCAHVEVLSSGPVLDI
jgi:hypothetical protein